MSRILSLHGCDGKKRIPLYITTSTLRSGQESIKNERLFPSPTFFETFTYFQKPQFRRSSSRIPLLAPLRLHSLTTARPGIAIYTSRIPSNFQHDDYFNGSTKVPPNGRRARCCRRWILWRSSTSLPLRPFLKTSNTLSANQE